MVEQGILQAQNIQVSGSIQADSVQDHLQSVCVVAQDGTILLVNDAWHAFARSAAADPTVCGVGANYLKVCETAGETDIAHGIRQVLTGAATRFAATYPCEVAGVVQWFEMTVTPLSAQVSAPAADCAPQLVVIAHVRVTREHELEQLLSAAALAQHPAPSVSAAAGGSSQRFFADVNRECALAADTGAKLGLLVIDLDRFGLVADALGMDAADNLLAQVAQRLGARTPDGAMVGRLGGDEFGLLFALDEHGCGVARQVNAWMAAFAQSFASEQGPVMITASGGVSVFPRDGSDARELQASAHAALRSAKAEGRAQWRMFVDNMPVETYKRYVMRSDLHRALAAGELLLHYQPRVNPFANRVVAAEALIRWEHPQWGLVLPGEFVSLAEQSGLIVAIGSFVIREAIAQIVRWRERGITPVPISVNVSSQQFEREGFVDFVLTELATQQVDAGLLEVELTETVVARDVNRVAVAVQALHDAGVRVAIDDFGTGYSSFGYLHRLAAHAIKIDRSFVAAMTEPSGRAIVRAMVGLAHELGLSAVAEGVENGDQIQDLLEFATDELQGYYFSRPLPAHAFAAVLEHGLPKGDRPALGANRRQYFRLPLPSPLFADMTITRLRGRPLGIGHTQVCVHNIGPGGLCFTTRVALSIEPNTTLRFSTDVFEPVAVAGHVVWRNEEASGLWRYGVEFDVDEAQREKLTVLLNQLAVKLKRRPVVPGCRFSSVPGQPPRDTRA